MIIDKLDNACTYYGLGYYIRRALEIAKTLTADCENGKVFVDGQRLYYTVMEPEVRDDKDGLFESHEKYIDVQVILRGTDVVGYEHTSNLTVCEDRLESADCLLYEGSASLISVPAGSFYIAYPQDAHKPNIVSCDKTPLKKAVFKVLLDA